MTSPVNGLTRFAAALSQSVLLSVSLQAEPIRVVVTGAAGQIAYSLLYSIAKGDVFGKDQVGPVLLRVGSNSRILHMFVSMHHMGQNLVSGPACVGSVVYPPVYINCPQTEPRVVKQI